MLWLFIMASHTTSAIVEERFDKWESSVVTAYDDPHQFETCILQRAIRAWHMTSATAEDNLHWWECTPVTAYDNTYVYICIMYNSVDLATYTVSVIQLIQTQCMIQKHNCKTCMDGEYCIYNPILWATSIQIIQFFARLYWTSKRDISNNWMNWEI